MSSREIPMDPDDLADALDSVAYETPVDPPLELERLAVELPSAVELKHDAELDRLIADDKIRADDPDFDQRAGFRRSMVYAHNLLTPAVGETPDDFVEPIADADYKPAPKAATGFKVMTTRRRRR